MHKIIALIAMLFVAVSAPAAVKIGVYDYNQTFTTSINQTYEEIFLSSWGTPDVLYPQATGETLAASLAGIRGRNRWPIVTVQPYHISSIGSAKNLLSDVAAGKYDATIAAVCTQIKAYNGPILIRWGHEMEMNIGRYDWSSSNYKAYIKAYQHAITVFKKDLAGLANVYYVWSPAGNNNCNSYYPGDGYVDYVGCSLYSWQAYYAPLSYSGTFDELMGWKYSCLSVHNKPVMICEEGVEVADPQAAWVAAAKAVYYKYPLIFAAVYFNSPDPIAWWTDGPIPDWSISPFIWTP